MSSCTWITSRAAARELRCSRRPSCRSMAPRSSGSRACASRRPRLARPGLDLRHEAFVHRLLLRPPFLRTAQQERLTPVRSGAQLHLHAVTHRAPVACLLELPAPVARLATRGPDQVAPTTLLEPRQVRRARHAAVHHPHALRQTEALLHRPDDLLDRRHVHRVAGEHLVAQRYPLARHHQRDAHLLAVRPMVATVPACGQRVLRRLALEVRARHVVQQQVVPQREQLAQSRLQVLLDRHLVRQQSIQRAVQTVVIHRLARQSEQILQRGAPVPVLGDVQLARRLAPSRYHQPRRHHRPRHRLAPRRQQPRAQRVQPQRTPQRPAQPHVPEGSAALQPHPLQPHRHRRCVRSVITNR